MPQVEADNWYGLVAPIATPQPILAKLHAAATEALHSAEVKDKLAAQGVVAVGNSSAEFETYVKSEIDRWGQGHQRVGHQGEVSGGRSHRPCCHASGISGRPGRAAPGGRSPGSAGACR